MGDGARCSEDDGIGNGMDGRARRGMDVGVRQGETRRGKDGAK